MAKKLSIALLSLRLSIFLVMLVWTIDKFIRPKHADMIFSDFYFFPSLDTTLLSIIGLIELIIIIAFLVGYKKRYSYGAVLILHTVSTLASFKQYIWFQLLFFAAWPMLAAIFTLFLLREYDVLWSLKNPSDHSDKTN